MSQPDSLIGLKRDRTARGDVALHDHVCGIYDTREQQYGPACQFVKTGLEHGEQCLYIAEQLSPAEFTRLLEAQGVDSMQMTTNGALQVTSGSEVRRTLDGFTPAKMLAFLAERAQIARNAGFSAFRLCADMTWLRQDDIDPTDFFRYESELTLLLQANDIVGLCQYSMEDFRSELLIAAVETHPLLVYDTIVCDNFYYVPPEEYLKPRFSDMKLKRMLINIISRKRLMHKFLAH